MERRHDKPQPGSGRVLRWVLGGLLVSALLIGTVGAALWLQAPGSVPLERVRIEGDVRRTGKEQLRQALASALHGSFFSIDLEAVRRSVQALPWVSQAGVRRVWPPALVVMVRERSAVARWGEDGLLSPQGEVFFPRAQSFPAGLPRLNGPEGSAPELLRRHGTLQDLLEARGMSIQSLAMNERHALSLQLSDGLRLLLGNREPEARLRRFLGHWAELRQKGVAASVDLRYPHGFSVRWSGQVAGGGDITGAEG
jgi:cell division protein FtsQ